MIRMRPSFAAFYSANGVFFYTIISRYLLLQASIFSYCSNLILSKFCSSTSFASIRSSMFYSVKLIVSRSIPSKIVNMIIARISIVMTSFKSFLTFSNKCSQYQRMRFANFDFIKFPQSNIRSIVYFRFCWDFDFPSFNGFYVSKIRNFIKTFKPNNRKPNFHSFAHMYNMGIL